MGRRPTQPLYTWPPDLAACVKWARHGGSPNPPSMTAREALAETYEELIDALNYLAIAQSAPGGPSDVEGLRQSVHGLAEQVRRLVIGTEEAVRP